MKISIDILTYVPYSCYSVGKLTPVGVPILAKLCSAILEYVYSAPKLVREAEECLDHLHAIQRKRKSRKSKNNTKDS